MDTGYQSLKKFVLDAKPIYKKWQESDFEYKHQFELQIYELLGKNLASDEITNTVRDNPAKIFELFETYNQEIHDILTVTEEDLESHEGSHFAYFFEFFETVKEGFGPISFWWEDRDKEKLVAADKARQRKYYRIILKRFMVLFLFLTLIAGILVYVNIVRPSLNKTKESATNYSEWHQVDPVILMGARKITSLSKSWDHDTQDLIDLVKSTMHEPNSFEHITSIYVESGEYGDRLNVEISFRGQNLLGDIVDDGVIVNIDLKNNLIEIEG